MSDETILYGLSEGVATITLNRPERLNALTPALFTEFVSALDRAVAEGARALLLTGAGKAFCSGADLLADGDGINADNLGAMLEAAYHPAIRAISALNMPVISAVNGPAAGAGVSLALSADIVIAAESSYFLLAFANIGLVPDAGSTWFVAQAVGRAKAMEMAMLGERIPAARAEALGLITRTVPDEALIDEARALAIRLANGPTLAMGMIRKQVAAAMNATLEETLALEAANQTIAGRTQDLKEAVIAFASKRKPQFRGQ